MNAKQMLLDYAAKNNDGKLYTDEQFIGKAMTDGVRIYRNSEFVTVRVRRENKTIILTETTYDETVAAVNGKAEITKTENTVEVFRVDL